MPFNPLNGVEGTSADIPSGQRQGGEVEDPLGDSTGSIDIRRMEMRWDKATGAHQITFFATGQAPFHGAFRINVNLFNVDDGSFFQDARVPARPIPRTRASSERR